MGYFLLLIYSLLAPVIAGLYALFFLLSPRRALMKSLGAEMKERLGLGRPAAGGPVWIHAASMGEVKAISKLAPELAAAFGAPFLITSSTASGRAEAAKLGEARLAPLDFYPLAAAFIKRNAPRMLVVAETEIWPATLYAAARAGVPVFMVNARISPRTLKLYKALSPLTRLAFSGVKKILAQSGPDAERFAALAGADRVQETGNLKHDLLGTPGTGAHKAVEFTKACGWEGSPLFTAGSTHPPEEPAVIAAWLEARKKTPGLKLVLVPRHPERAEETAAALDAAGVKHVRWTGGPAAGADCLVVDAMGLLLPFYSISEVCFVGGTLDDTGGHNVLEPALFGKPAVFGPNYRNARHAGDALIKGKGGFLAGTAPEMASVLSELLTVPGALQSARERASSTLASLRGATARTMAAVRAAMPG